VNNATGPRTPPFPPHSPGLDQVQEPKHPLFFKAGKNILSHHGAYPLPSPVGKVVPTLPAWLCSRAGVLSWSRKTIGSLSARRREDSWFSNPHARKDAQPGAFFFWRLKLSVRSSKKRTTKMRPFPSSSSFLFFLNSFFVLSRHFRPKNPDIYPGF
jgi:hypothetical protein